MDSAAYIKQRQVLWARRRGLELAGSAGDRGDPAYVHSIPANLYQPLSPDAEDEFRRGDGGELSARRGPAKMQAVHSSAALAVNVFMYWRTLGILDPILSACGLPTVGVRGIRFEGKLPALPAAAKDPNLDVVIDYAGPRNSKWVCAIECKFTEAYSDRGEATARGLKHTYLAHPHLWKDLPNLRQMAEAISPTDGWFTYLHAAQLLKHILGIRRSGGGLVRGRLMYLWYDVPGEAGARHRTEVGNFAKFARADGVRFQDMTYQDLILTLARRHRDRHAAYIDYLAERYL